MRVFSKLTVALLFAPLAISCSNDQSRPFVSSINTATQADFPKVGGNLSNQNYSALNSINQNNISNLGGAWLNRIENGEGRSDSQGTPIVVDGVIYIESAEANVIAVDGKTGETLWRWEQTHGRTTRRGLGFGDGKLYTLSGDGWVIALDQHSGELVWERNYSEY